MTVNQATGTSIYNALQAAGFSGTVLYYAMAQAALESAGFTSNIYTSYNNASGITYGGSAAQIATGATDSGQQQAGGTLDWAAYPNLNAWAADFYRILNIDNGAGAPINAVSDTDYVNRLQVNGYFGSDSASQYLTNLDGYYNVFISQFAPASAPAPPPSSQPAATPPDTSPVSWITNALAGLNQEWVVIIAATIVVGLLTFLVFSSNVFKMRTVAATILFLILANMVLAQATPAPLPPPNYASYGKYQLTTYDPQLSILDSELLACFVKDSMLRVTCANCSGGGGGGGTYTSDSALRYDPSGAFVVGPPKSVMIDQNTSYSVFLAPQYKGSVFVDTYHYSVFVDTPDRRSVFTDNITGYSVFKDQTNKKSVFIDQQDGVSAFTDANVKKSVFVDQHSGYSVFEDKRSEQSVFTDRNNEFGVFTDSLTGRSVFAEPTSERSVFVTQTASPNSVFINPNTGTSIFGPGQANMSNSVPVAIASDQVVSTGGLTKNVAVTPTISTSAYTSGYVIGGVMSFTNLIRVNGGTGQLMNIMVREKGTQQAPLTLLIFSQNPSNGTYTDNSAFTFNATDFTYLVRQVSVTSGNYVTCGAFSVADLPAIGKTINQTSSGTTIYVIALVGSTPTYSSSSNLTISLGVLQD